jgi:hypothetical protein
MVTPDTDVAVSVAVKTAGVVFTPGTTTTGG